MHLLVLIQDLQKGENCYLQGLQTVSNDKVDRCHRLAPSGQPGQPRLQHHWGQSGEGSGDC